ncbi:MULTISPECIES: hypothetical protein [Pantoea]|uniref:hypothetical protein n=1 Tax=Pantoea TaxID=53335 RepID=UPI001F4654C4|nr:MULTISPECIES: hypothetical protein [Pantoea]UIL51443.1 hypothetical protein LZU96_14555 [Pantoea agglomerans]
MPTHLPAFFNPASHQTKKICPLLTTSGDFQIIKSAFLLSQINPSGPATPLQPAIWLHFRQSTINIDLNQRSAFFAIRFAFGNKQRSPQDTIFCCERRDNIVRK